MSSGELRLGASGKDKRRRLSGESSELALARNKRMFGMLNSTIQSSSLAAAGAAPTKAANKLKQIELKLAKEKDAANLKREQKLLDRKREQEERDRAAKELKAALRAAWDKHNDTLNNFILLKTSPRLFYLPAKHNTVSEKLLAASKEERAGALGTASVLAKLNGGASEEIYTIKPGTSEDVGVTSPNPRMEAATEASNSEDD